MHADFPSEDTKMPLRSRATVVPAIAAIALPLLLAACNPGDTNADGSPKPEGIIARQIDAALVEAKAQVENGNIDLNQFRVTRKDGGIQVGGKDISGVPGAEITPDGRLLIEGREIEVTDPVAKAALADYREQIEAIAVAGIEVGRQGADIGLKAAGEALRGVFTGNTDDIEKRIEGQAKGLEKAALALCGQLPGLLRAQQAVAAVVPEFKPYARLTEADVTDCYADAKERESATADARHETRAQVRDGIRQGIREGVREGARMAGAEASSGTADDGGAGNAADEADAAAETSRQ